MDTLTITLNGARLEAVPGETILDAAKRNGVYIPTLCHEKRLEPFGSCRVCLVKVEGAKAYIPSCSTKVAEGMVVSTESPEIVEARHLALSLLVSEHYGDCVSPCSAKCPAHIDIQGYIALINAGAPESAVRLIKERNPLPLSIGRVCPHPCETVCRREGVEEPIAINNLKRYAADHDIALEHPYVPELREKNGKRVAVVGSGPAGLSAAFYLAWWGYDVAIFEKHPKGGGMLRYGIPEYRLPKAVLDQEIGLVEMMGVRIRYGRELGRDFSIDDLKSEGFDAVFLGLGAWKSIGLRIGGEDLPGVMSGIDFLYDVASGTRFDFSGKTVMVVGGGNTAMDAARTSVRLGAKKVTILYRRTKEEMPANEIEIAEAEEEGIVFEYLAAPIRIEASAPGAGAGESGGLNVECIRMQLGQPDESGRRRPVPIEDSGHTIRVDRVITAVGQAPDLACLKDRGLLTQRETLKAGRESGTTSDDFVFGGGDCVTGPATAIEAVAAGRIGAESIDIRLGTGVKRERPPLEFSVEKGSVADIPAEFFGHYEKAPRAVMPSTEPALRVKGFGEIEKGLSLNQALAESARCLECGCTEGFSCALRDNSTLFSVKAGEFKVPAQVAGGWHDETLRHPSIVREESKCVRCGICVRVCDEVWGLHVYGFVKRGSETQVEPSFGLPLSRTECDFCGQCADACPTGALSLGSYLPKPGPFKVEKHEGICLHCSLGCSLEYNVYGGMLVKVTSSPGMGENDGNLCVRGRFGYRYLRRPFRTQEFLELANGGKTPIGRNRALEESSKILSKAKRPAILCSTQLSNEELEAVSALSGKLEGAEVYHVALDPGEASNGEAGGHAGALDAGIATGGELELAGTPAGLAKSLDGAATPSLVEIGSSDLLLLFNILPGRHYPILEMHVRRAVRRGAALYVINDTPIRLDDRADGVFRVKGDRGGRLLELIRNLLSKKAAPDATLLAGIGVKPGKVAGLVAKLKSAGSAALVADAGRCTADELESFAGIAGDMKNRAKVLLLRKGMNPNGARILGSPPAGSARLSSRDAFLVFGATGVDTGGKPFVHIGFSPFGSRGGRGIFLPASSLLETGGTTHLYNGKPARISPILECGADRHNLSYLSDLAGGPQKGRRTR